MQETISLLPDLGHAPDDGKTNCSSSESLGNALSIGENLRELFRGQTPGPVPEKDGQDDRPEAHRTQEEGHSTVADPKGDQQCKLDDHEQDEGSIFQIVFEKL